MRRSHWYLAAAAAAVVGLAGLRACSSPDTGTAGPAPTATSVPVPAASGGGPSTSRHGVPAGWSHDRAGALGAAVSAVRLTGQIAAAGFITRDDMITELATDAYGPVLAAESSAQLEAMSGELGAAGITVQSVELHELPLTARVVDADDRAATVEVWAVTVVIVADVAAPRQVWRTITVELAWEGGDWRVDGWSARLGPTPALAVNAPVATAEEMQTVTGWPLAGGG